MSFLGPIPASKSLMNRALIIQSYFPQLELRGASDCDDVNHMRLGLEKLFAGEPIDCGDGGTVLRFLALRASRRPGRHRLKGNHRLMARPQDELLKILAQLGVDAVTEKNELLITSSGWKPQGDTLYAPSHRSSQFVSSVLLNAWELPFELFVSPVGAGVSEGYWRMTQVMATELGMKIDKWDNDFRIPSNQKIQKLELSIEPDMSTAFALAASAAVNGSATLLDFPDQSLQPDYRFVDILQKMGVPVQRDNDRLKIQKASSLCSVAVKLTTSPDLFPVLSALCAMAEGDSELYGAPQLVHKESNRIEKVKELLTITGRTVEAMSDGIRIKGKLEPRKDELVFDPDHDHRLAMAAAVLRLAGLPVRILHPEVVNKSFPGFWQAVGLNP